MQQVNNYSHQHRLKKIKIVLDYYYYYLVIISASKIYFYTGPVLKAVRQSCCSPLPRIEVTPCICQVKRKLKKIIRKETN